ncbi:MAG TPA: ABC transporter substrate-binding protein, partial [Acidimicrobiales bacterium]|nr:ABC transporter substrate-binding protein [Acidimicrobiales bacterium]
MPDHPAAAAEGPLASRRDGPAVYSRRSFLARSAAFAAVGGIGSLGGALTGAPSAWATQAPPLGNIALQLGWVKNVSYAGSYIAETRGYYRQHGVNVTILSGGPTVAGIPVLVSGKALVAISDPTTVSGAISHGADVWIVGAGYQTNPACIMSLASKPITTPHDLLGKKIGVSAADEPTWQAFLKINGITPSSVDTIPAGFDPSPVASGEWDGYLAFSNNEPPQFASEGIKTALLMFQDYGLPSISEVYVVTGATLSNAT